MNANTEPSFNIYVMSYKRSKTILTQNCFSYCTYVVREEEADDYRKAGVKNVLPIPSGEVSDFMSTLYWIINNTPEDVICIADDDIKHFVYRTFDTNNILDNEGKPDKETATAEVERIGQMLYDLELGLSIDTIVMAGWAYQGQFQFKGMPGHIRWINKKCLKAKYNPEDLATSDVDMMYQELAMNRVVLQNRYFLCNAFMDKNEGAIENRQEHIDMTIAMKNKWGRYYDYDYKKNQAHINVSR